MAAKKPKIGDPIVYRGRYREVIGWRQADGSVGKDRTDEIVYRNPVTERDTRGREADLRWSDYLGAWFPVGLVLSKEECCVYAALPGTIGNGVPPATSHEAAVRLLDAEDLDQELDDAAQRRFARALAGYWPSKDKAGKPTGQSDRDPAEVLAAAKELRAHREEVRDA